MSGLTTPVSGAPRRRKNLVFTLRIYDLGFLCRCAADEPTFLRSSLLRLRFLLLRPAALPAIDSGLLFAHLGLRATAHATVPLAATTKVQRRYFAGCPGSGLCTTGQANQVGWVGWATWQRLLITALVPSPTNGIAQRVILAPAPPLVRCRFAHGVYPSHRRSISGAAGR